MKMKEHDTFIHSFVKQRTSYFWGGFYYNVLLVFERGKSVYILNSNETEHFNLQSHSKSTLQDKTAEYYVPKYEYNCFFLLI